MRLFLTQAALIGLLTLLWGGCGRSPVPLPAPEPSPSPTPEVEPTPPPKPLHLYYRHDSIPRAIIEQFAHETGIPVEIETYASDEQMLANLLSGRNHPDLIEPGESVIEGLIKENLLLPLNQTALPNLRYLDPKFRNLPFDPGNVFTVPYRADTVGIVINSERVNKKIDGYEDVFAGRYRGRIVVLDNSREIMSWAFATLGLPIDEVTNSHLDQAKPLLSRWLRQIKAYDSDHPEALLENGEADIGILRSDSAATLLQTDKKFRWILPREGSHLSVDSLCIPRSASRVEAALAFINFLLRPEISAEISRTDARINPHAAARKILAEESSLLPTALPEVEEFSRLKTHRDIGNQSLRVDEIVNGLKAP